MFNCGKFRCGEPFKFYFSFFRQHLQELRKATNDICILNDRSLSKQGPKAGFNSAPCASLVRSFKPRQAHTHMNHLGFFESNTEFRLDLHQDAEKNVNFWVPWLLKGRSSAWLPERVSAETKKSEDHADTGYILHERLHGKRTPEGIQVCCFFLNIFEWTSTDVFDCTDKQIKAVSRSLARLVDPTSKLNTAARRKNSYVSIPFVFFATS